MLKDLLSRWPVIQQIRNGSDGTGPEAWSEHTRNLKPKTAGCEVTRGVCPYCGVGCGQLVYHKDGKLVSIEGDPASPISRGHLCPKGANTHQLHSHPGRLTKVKYRRPYAKDWEDLDLDTAMEMIADRVLEGRRKGWQDEEDGKRVNRTMGIASLGGATLDNEENYLMKKLYTAMGAVQVENQARI
jgi:formate dehydrogenase major subunit